MSKTVCPLLLKLLEPKKFKRMQLVAKAVLENPEERKNMSTAMRISLTNLINL